MRNYDESILRARRIPRAASMRVWFDPAQTDVARLASDIALLEDDIARVADACALAQGNRRRVNNNFRLAVGLNSAILGAAAFGWLRPVSTSMLHNGSTIGILLHALLGARLPGARRSRSWQARERMPLQEKATCC